MPLQGFRSYLQIIEMNLENKYFQVRNRQENEQKSKNIFNNWLQPPPMQFHLINSPSLNFELSQMTPQTSIYSPEFFKNKSRDLTKVPKRNKERQRFKKLREELRVLQTSLQNYKELKESELLAYKQTLLMEYLGSFIKDIAVQCNQKAEFVRQIWNTLIRIFNQLFQRLVCEGKQRQRLFLRDQIKTHNDYQSKLQEYMKINQQLKESDSKYQGIIKELVTNIAKSNTELKGLRSIFDFASINLKEITQKYEELRAEHVEVLVNGFYDPISREKAEALMMDKEMLLFAKKMTNSKKGVRQKKGERRAKLISNEIDVNLLLEELQAEQQYSFEMDQAEKKEVTYTNQKVQTTNISKQGQHVSLQSDYFSRRQYGMLKQKSIQTNIQNKILKLDTSTQVKRNQFYKQFKIYHVIEYAFYHCRLDEDHSIKLIKSSGKQHQSSTYKKLVHMQDACTSISVRQFQQNESIQTSDHNIIQPKRRESKMIKVSNRQSQRGSRIYFQKALKTQNSGDKKRFSQSSKKMSNYSRKSQFIIFQNLKQNMVKNISNFRKNYSKLHSLQQNILSKILSMSTESNSFDSLIDSVLLQLSYQSLQKDKAYYQNLQLSKINTQIQDKLNLSVGPYKKTASFVNLHKCLKGINEIYKIAKRYINIGYRSINLLVICCQYLTAIEGKIVDLESNSKRLIDFLRSCLTLYGENYLIRNFILLSGLQPPSKDERVLKMSKISFDSIKNKTQMMKMNKTIDFPTVNYSQHASEEDTFQNLSPLMIYYSEVDVYFELLQSLNCSQNKQDLSKYYTTFERVQKIIYIIEHHYKNSSLLISDITEAIKLSIQDWGSQSQCKLNIFKCLQLIMDKILAYKISLLKDFNQILKHSDDLSQKMMKTYIHQLISLSGVTQSEYIQLIIISDEAYQEVNINNLSTLFLIQGLKLDLVPFFNIEKQCRVNLLKKVAAYREEDRRYSAIIDSYSKVNMKKRDIYLMLRGLWIKQSNKIFGELIGADLQTLFGITIPFGQSNRGVGFHQMIRQAFHFW